MRDRKSLNFEEMNAILTICHFCELHGPRTIFNTQTTGSSLIEQRDCNKSNNFNHHKKKSLSTLEEFKCHGTQAYPVNDTCSACQSFPMNPDKYLVTQDEGSNSSFVSSQYPLQEELFALVRQAGIRSLSCEVYSDREGPIYFGDDSRGHVISYIFFLKDVQARGFLRRYSILVLMRDKMFLLNSWSFFIKHFEEIITKLQEDAMKVYQKEEESLNCNVDTFKRHRSVGNPRPLTELVSNEGVWKDLHAKLSWILKAGGLRLQEKVVQSLPLNVPFQYNETFDFKSLLDTMAPTIFEKILHHLFTGQKVLLKSSKPEILNLWSFLLKLVLPVYLYHPKELNNHNLHTINDENILTADLDLVFYHCKYLKISFTDPKMQVLEPLPLYGRIPQIVNKICLLFSENKFSPPVLNLYLTSLLEEWNNKVETWSFLQKNGSKLSSASCPSTLLPPSPSRSCSQTGLTATMLMSVGALECDVPLLDALTFYQQKYA